MLKLMYEESHMEVQSVSFFYVVWPLLNALGPTFKQLFDSAWKEMFWQP